MTKRRFAALAAVITLAACTKVGTAPDATVSANAAAGGRHAYTIPHVLRYATAEDVAGLNPLLFQQTTLSLMSSLTMAYLIKFDERNRPYPELATSVPAKANGGISRDGLRITYHLRKGLRWSDGAPLDADDVVFTAHAVLNPANNILSREGWDKITTIDEPDKYTVTFHLSRPYGSYIPTFFTTAGANPCILPKHLLARLPEINDAPYNAKPVGAGPFMYAEWKRGDRVEMVRNPFYFRGQPKLERVVFKIVPDRNTVMTQIKTHELDLWMFVPGGMYDALAGAAGITEMKAPSFSFNHIDFNLAHPAVADPVVRRALMLATDRRTIHDKILHHLGILQDAFVAPISPYYDPHIGFTEFNVAKANALLDAAGWKRGADGIRAKNGVRLALVWAASAGTPDGDSAIEIIRSAWQQLGVELNVQHFPSASLFGPYQSGGILYNGKFDVTLFGWTLDAGGDPSALYQCSRVPPHGQNILHYCSSLVDTALAAFRTTYSVSERRPYSWTFQAQIARDVPTIVTTVRLTTWVMNDDLRGFAPNGSTYFDNFMNVDI